MRLTFLGAAGTVTGSKYLIETDDARVLVDCGLFQGLKQWRLQNWSALPIEPAAIDAIVLTHAHLDHCGYLPILVRDGFTGRVYCTGATRDLCAVILPDSGRLQEEDADHANQHGYSRHHPALPLYSEIDAVRALGALQGVALGESIPIADGLSATLSAAGHILGAACVRVQHNDLSVLFSGDLGRPDDTFTGPPAPPPTADHIVLESTYGDRLHSKVDPREALAQAVIDAARRGGSLLIPAFAVARAQLLICILHQLRVSSRIPDIPIVLDTPMGALANEVFLKHAHTLALDATEFRAALAAVHVTRSVDESRRLDAMSMPRVIISASGMATGGRILHHLAALAPDHRNTIALCGYQVAGTRGADLRSGAGRIKIHGRYVDVRARVTEIGGLSSHADYAQTLQWLAELDASPRTVFITHGDPASADALRRRIEERFAWRCHVPIYRERIELPASVPTSVPDALELAAVRGW
jgi:metallo-beta-lactamase family protein